MLGVVIIMLFMRSKTNKTAGADKKQQLQQAPTIVVEKSSDLKIATGILKQREPDFQIQIKHDYLITKDCCSRIGTKFAGLYLWFGLANLNALWI
jgi:hypothetical protein